MKTLKLSGLLTLLVCCSCKLLDHEPKFVNYNLRLSFQDPSGNDLVKGIELEKWWPENFPCNEAFTGSIDRNLYTLNIIFSESCKSSFIYDPTLSWGKSKNYDRIVYYLRIQSDDCPVMNMLIYRVKCFYVFGDDAFHEIVTYWDVPKIRNGSGWGKCYRIEFEGKVFTDITHESSQKQVYTSISTIVLDK